MVEDVSVDEDISELCGYDSDDDVIGKRTLLLGMVYAKPECAPHPDRGQMYRDRVRCEAMEKLGYDVVTLDNKHKCQDALDNKHCETCFTSPQRMFNSMKETLGNEPADIIFDRIILDYFFCPEGYVQERWTSHFFEKTLPLISDMHILANNGEIWLPNMLHVQKMMQRFRNILSVHYEWERVANPNSNPLYAATETVEAELARCPDNRTNRTQLEPLLGVSEQVFFVIRRRKLKRVLLLNMCFSSGAGVGHKMAYREDRMRCLSLEEMGFDVKTVDRGHDDNDETGLVERGMHCRANVDEAPQFLRAMARKWHPRERVFHHICADYLIDPIDSSLLYPGRFFSGTLPLLARMTLKRGGEIWLPNSEHVQMMLRQFSKDLAMYYHIRDVKNPLANPLYNGTMMTAERIFGDRATREHASHMKKMVQFSDHPFVQLKLKEKAIVGSTKSTDIEEQSSSRSGISDGDGEFGETSSKQSRKRARQS